MSELAMLLSRPLSRPVPIISGLCCLGFLYLLFFWLPSRPAGDHFRKLAGSAATTWSTSGAGASYDDRAAAADGGEVIRPPSLESSLPSRASDAPSAASASPSLADASTLTGDSQTHELSRPGPGDKIIVMGRLQHEDTDWVQKHLPDWQHAIYAVDNTSFPLHTPQNKGKEANPYLFYIIQNYDRLPSTIAFLHSHRDGYPGGWHTDAPDYDNVVSMQTLQLEFVRSNGYVNLRCNWIPGCPDEVQYARNPEDTDSENVEHQVPAVWRHFFGAESRVPEVVATPCCAQFAVSREQVLARPREDYIRFYSWLMNTPLSDASSGRIMEYMWHVIFGKEAVYCPEMSACYRNVYGREVYA